MAGFVLQLYNSIYLSTEYLIGKYLVQFQLEDVCFHNAPENTLPVTVLLFQVLSKLKQNGHIDFHMVVTIKESSFK